MAFINWSPALSVGIPTIDAQHQKLVALVNTLYEAMSAGKGNDVIGHVIQELTEYTRTHFSYEEGLFAMHGYPNAEAHIAEHKALLADVAELHARFKRGEKISAVSVGTFLKNWLAKHIQGADRDYQPLFVSKGVR